MNEEEINSDILKPFVFKMPLGNNFNSTESVDLKWLREQLESINKLFDTFLENYKNLIKLGNHPTELLKAQFTIISALSNYQITLLEHQNKRHGHIESESELQDMMNQMENIMKMFKEGK